jgi:drug/metabolite transporter (DMT)-like permease
MLASPGCRGTFQGNEATHVQNPIAAGLRLEQRKPQQDGRHSMTGNLRSILAMLAAVGSFSLMDAALKTLAGSYPTLQVAALRGLTALPLVCLYVLWRRETHLLLRIRWSLHLVRGAIGIAMLSLFTFSLKELGLAEAYTIFFVAPLLITILSIPVLKETVSARHWAAIAVGLGGVVVALRPDQDAFFSLGAIAVLIAAAFYAIAAIAGRVLSRTDAAVTLVFWTTTMWAVGASVLAWPNWVPVASAHWPVLLALAVTGFLGQIAITEAFRHGNASAVAPFEYTALAWAIVLDYVFWNAVPDRYTLLGGAIIIASGIYLIRKEKIQDVTVTP